MEDKRINQDQEQNNDVTKATTTVGGVRTSGDTEDTRNPINSGGEPTYDTENKAAVAQTRNPTSRATTGSKTKTFITGSDSDGQL